MDDSTRVLERDLRTVVVQVKKVDDDVTVASFLLVCLAFLSVDLHERTLYTYRHKNCSTEDDVQSL